jgi:hypothetical protein
MAITQAQLASTVTTVLYESFGQNAVTTMLFCNVTTSTNATFDLFVVPFTTSSHAGYLTQIIKGVSLPGTETFVFDTERLILEDGDKIYGQASNGGTITATISTVQTA